MKSAEYALIQADNAELGNQEGYIKDADNKYKKLLNFATQVVGAIVKFNTWLKILIPTKLSKRFRYSLWKIRFYY